jgi:hypothetical protein
MQENLASAEFVAASAGHQQAAHSNETKNNDLAFIE